MAESGNDVVGIFMMKELIYAGASIAGWNVQTIERLPEVQGSLVRMEYEKNGAELAWLDRDDENMTFAIAFKTVPEDDTGVAHILEHSVLCGSEKYPVKEPFVDLLKGSFATFLNAWTAPDHTAYPVCSRNKTDFLNLIDVYLDAVLHPSSMKNPAAFRQEGWHYERDGTTGGLKRTGVVYSEMKGAFANPLHLAATEAERLLFAGSAYGYVSGGDPDSIPDLTFAKYRDFYERHYHPSNAKIFLDGKVDIKPVLEKIDAYFRGYGRKKMDVAISPAIPRRAEKTVPYALAAGESAEGKAILAEAWLWGGYDDTETREAMSVLCQALAGSNEEPLAAALIKKGICENAMMWSQFCLQGCAMLVLQNVADGKIAEAQETVASVMRALASNGLDRARLKAILSRDEFEYRERDFGKDPRGLAYFSAAMDRWLYGGDPADAFKSAGVFESLRKKIDEGWFEEFLRKAFIDNAGRASVTLMPDSGLAARREKEERESLAAVEAEWSDADRESFARDSAELKAFQENPDPPEAAAKLPKLKISDIPEEGPAPQYEKMASNRGAETYRVKTGASGIVYVSLFFPLDGLDRDQLAEASFGADLYGELDTRDRPVAELKNAIDAELGRFSVSTGAYGSKGGDGRPGRGRAYLVARAAALESRADGIVPLLKEILRRSVFEDAEKVSDLLTQQRRALEFSTGGMGAKRFATLRALSSVSESGALMESLGGIHALRRYQALDDAFEKDGEKTCARIGALMSSIIARGAKYIFVSSNSADALIAEAAVAFEYAGNTPCSPFPVYPKAREGFIGTGEVASASKAAFAGYGSGADFVGARILTLDWLWREIRVRGGAYGGSLAKGPFGSVQYLSWNDPSAARSLDVYDKSGDALRVAAEKDFSNYVISAVASTEPYLSPSAEIEAAENLVLTGRTSADVQNIRREMLGTTREQLLGFAARLDGVSSNASVCVVGGKSQVESCGNSIDKVENIYGTAADKDEMQDDKP